MGSDDPLYDESLDGGPWIEVIVVRPAATGSRGDAAAESPSARIWAELRRAATGARIDLSAENPFITIWTRPRATIRSIVETDATRHVVPIAMLAAISQSLNRASYEHYGDRMSLSTILVAVSVLGSIAGVAGLYVVGSVLGLIARMLERWLGAPARPREFRAAIAWSSIPTLAGLPIWIAWIARFGREVFTTDTPTFDAHPVLGSLFLTWLIIASVLRSWSLGLLVCCVAELQGVSRRRTRRRWWSDSRSSSWPA